MAGGGQGWPEGRKQGSRPGGEEGGRVWRAGREKAGMGAARRGRGAWWSAAQGYRASRPSWKDEVRVEHPRRGATCYRVRLPHRGRERAGARGTEGLPGGLG